MLKHAMKKLLIILVCLFSFECYALDVSHQRKVAFGLGKDYFNKLITKKIYYEKLQACADTGNKTCSSLLGIEYFLDNKYSQAYPLLINGKDFNEMRYCFLGHMFGDGLGVLQNQNKAIIYYKKGAFLGDRDSARTLC
jgi:TPR repeat protein